MAKNDEFIEAVAILAPTVVENIEHCPDKFMCSANHRMNSVLIPVLVPAKTRNRYRAKGKRDNANVWALASSVDIIVGPKTDDLLFEAPLIELLTMLGIHLDSYPLSFFTEKTSFSSEILSEIDRISGTGKNAQLKPSIRRIFALVLCGWPQSWKREVVPNYVRVEPLSISTSYTNTVIKHCALEDNGDRIRAKTDEVNSPVYTTIMDKHIVAIAGKKRKRTSEVKSEDNGAEKAKKQKTSTGPNTATKPNGQNHADESDNESEGSVSSDDTLMEQSDVE